MNLKRMTDPPLPPAPKAELLKFPFDEKEPPYTPEFEAWWKTQPVRHKGPIGRRQRSWKAWAWRGWLGKSRADEIYKRLFENCYLPRGEAGGPNECNHGYAEGIPCRSCDLIAVGINPYPQERSVCVV